MRVALDHYCGECWYNRWEQRAGALASMACSDLEGVIGIAEKMGREGGDGSQGFIVEINRKSLEYRRKQQLKPEPPPQRSESLLGGNAEQQNETLQPWWQKPKLPPKLPGGVPRDVDFPKESSLLASVHRDLPGHAMVENFCSAEEEEAILAWLDGEEGEGYTWKESTFNGPHRAKRWGVLTDLAARKMSDPIRALPVVLHPLIRRMRQIVNVPCMGDFQPNEANAIEYKRKRGDYLGAHCDDRHLSGPVLCNLCLAGSAIMVYSRDHGKAGKGKERLKERYLVPLPRRALQVQSGTVRYDYRHGIPNGNLLQDRRVSITFRQNIHRGAKFY